MQVRGDFVRPPRSTDKTTLIIKVSKGATIRNRYNPVPHLAQDPNGKVTNSQLDITRSALFGHVPWTFTRIRSTCLLRNVYYMLNKMVTNGCKGKSIKLMGILLTFMALRILMGPSPLYFLL